MCLQQLSNETLLAILGVAGTLIGTLGGAYFAYRSIDKQFSQSIKKMRVERTFLAYEQLLEVIIAVQSILTFEGKRMSPALAIQHFSLWYSQFQPLWHQKQYLLDDESLIACRRIAEFIARFTEKYPQFRTGQVPEGFPSGPTPELIQDVVASHSEFLALLEAARSLETNLIGRRTYSRAGYFAGACTRLSSWNVSNLEPGR